MTADIEAIRAQIPALANSVYVNSGWSGPCSRRVLDAISGYLEREAAAGPTSARGFTMRAEVDRRARAAWAALLRCDPGEVVLTENTTDGINLVISGIPWRERDRLVVTSIEHPSVTVPALFAARRYGLDLAVAGVGASQTQQEMLDAFDRAVTPGTRLLALSHVGYTNGVRLPLAEIIALAHARGALVLADGAQALGQMALDVHALGIDFYAGPGQKWLCGPDGTGVLYVRRELTGTLNPSRIGYWAATEFDSSGRLEEYVADARRFEGSTTNGGLWAGLVEAAAIQQELGFDWIEEYVTGLASSAVRRLLAIPGVRLVSPREGASVSGLVCFRVGDLEPDAVTATLWERAGITGGGRQDRSGRRVPYTESTRLSLNYFNTEQDLDRIAEEVARIADSGPVPDLEGCEWFRSMHPAHG